METLHVGQDYDVHQNKEFQHHDNAAAAAVANNVVVVVAVCWVGYGGDGEERFRDHVTRGFFKGLGGL